MRATRAYITSFGTTGLLIASAFLMLTVMSAFVAFNGFPGQDVEDPIGTLLLQERQAAVIVPAHPVSVRAEGAKRASSSAAAKRRVAAGRADGPVAGTGPVVDRTHVSQPGTTQAPASAPPPSGASSPAGSVTDQLTGGSTTPSLPDVNLPPAPTVTVPQVSPPPTQNSQLPVDTSGVTDILGGG